MTDDGRQTTLLVTSSVVCRLLLAMDDFPKLLIVLGISITLVGVLWLGWTRFFGSAQLPGTFVFQGENMTCVIPILASIILSIVLTIVLNVLPRLFK